jgi:hypothetical protein
MAKKKISQPYIVPVRGSWVIRAKRDAIYKIISDFESMPKNFPRIAHSIKVVSREGQKINFEAESASFGRFFPRAKINVSAELLPGKGYRCKTHNLTFNTTGEEELLLVDDPEGTRIEYTYFVTVKNRRWAPLFEWLVRHLALPFWKKNVVDRLKVLVKS